MNWRTHLADILQPVVGSIVFIAVYVATVILEDEHGFQRKRTAP